MLTANQTEGHLPVFRSTASIHLSDATKVVGVTGFEPATSSSRTKRATKLRYTPICDSRMEEFELVLISTERLLGAQAQWHTRRDSNPKPPDP